MPEQDLRMKASLEGNEQVASGLKGIDEAQGKVTDTTTAQTTTVKDATKAQDKLNAAESDYVGLLSRISPALGAMVDGAIKGTKVLGDLATQKINLNAIGKKLTSTLGGVGNGVKLLGATGVAVAGLTILYKTISKVREESQRAEEALKSLIAARTELAAKSIEEAKAVAGARDETSRRRDPFTFPQQESVRDTLDAAPEDVREKLKAITRALSGAAGFGPEPGEFRGGELEALARLGWQPEPEAPQDFNERSARRYLDRRPDHVRIIEERQRAERDAVRSRAVQEALGDGTEGRANLRNVIQEKAHGLGLDDKIDRLMEIAIQQIREDVKPRAGEGDYQFFGLPSTPGAANMPHVPPPRGVSQWEGWQGMGGPVAGGESLSVPEATALTEAFRELSGEIKSIASTTSQPNIGIQQNFGPDASSMRSRETTGETIGRDKE